MSPTDSGSGDTDASALQARLGDLERLIRAELEALAQQTGPGRGPQVDLPPPVLSAASALTDPGAWLAGQRLTLATRDLVAFLITIDTARTAPDPIAWLVANGLPPPSQPDPVATLAPLAEGLARSRAGWEPAPGPNPIDPRRLATSLGTVLRGEHADAVNAAIYPVELYLRMRQRQRNRQTATHDEAVQGFLAAQDPSPWTRSEAPPLADVSTLFSHWIRCRAAVLRNAATAGIRTTGGPCGLPGATPTMTDATEFGVNGASDRLTPFWRRLVAVLEGLRDAAAVAPDPTPHTLCHTHQGTVLRHYRSKRPRPDSMPVLIVGGWLHRAELLDLGPNRSLIRALTERGMDVWMLDWNAASPLPTDWSVEECLTTVLLSTIDYVAGATANRPFGLLGVGEAGLLVLAAAARRLAGIAGVVIESGGAGDGSAWPSLVDLFQEADFAALVPRLPGMVTGLLEHGLLGIGEELIPAMEHLLAPYPVQSSSLACSIRWSLDRPDLPTRLLKEYREVSGGCGNWLAGRTGAAHPGSVSGQVQVLDLVGAHGERRSVQPHAEPPAVIRSGGYEARTIPGPRSAAFMSATEFSAVAATIDLWFSSLG